MPPKMILVASSTVYALGYSSETREAFVQFWRNGQAGDTYRYENVTPEDMCFLTFADSIGKAMAIFKAKYSLYHKLPAEVPSPVVA